MSEVTHFLATFGKQIIIWGSMAEVAHFLATFGKQIITWGSMTEVTHFLATFGKQTIMHGTTAEAIPCIPQSAVKASHCGVADQINSQQPLISKGLPPPPDFKRRQAG